MVVVRSANKTLWSRSEQRLSRWRLNAKALVEHLVEIIHVIKVLTAVLRRLSHLFHADHIVNDFTKVAGRRDSPVLQHERGHITELVERVPTDRFTKLLARQMLFGATAFVVIAVAGITFTTLGGRFILRRITLHHQFVLRVR